MEIAHRAKAVCYLHFLLHFRIIGKSRDFSIASNFENKIFERSRIIMKVRSNIGILQNYHQNANGIYVNEYLLVLPNGYNSGRLEFPNDGQFAEDYLTLIEIIDPYAERLGFLKSQKTIERVRKKAGR